MKKKLLTIMLIMTVLAAMISGCGSKKKDQGGEGAPAAEASAETAEAAETATDAATEDAAEPAGADTTAESAGSESDDAAKDMEALSNISVDKQLLNVTLTIPKEYVGETTQEELDLTVKEKGYKSATLNEDGSVTYVITKAQHKELMEDVKNTINQALSEMAGSENCPNVTSVTANEDYTSFTITTKNAEPDVNESFAALAMYMYGGMYAIFNGEDAENIHVDFVNADTGEVISSADSKNLGGGN
ncbi:MAG: hypothetical protein IJH81_05815 [Lachnospiraceae bacterium]|nr:hypothetical protein [Lachnospiraceae bacterium]MBQ6635863.1 hypothetical protein [Lachnospiraceae bacterium]